MFYLYSTISYRNFAGRLVFFTDELDDWMDRSPGLSDAQSLADAIYRQLCRRPPKKRKKKKSDQDQQPDPGFTATCSIEQNTNNLTLPKSDPPSTGPPQAMPLAGPPPPPTVPQSGPVARIPISPPAANADPVPVNRPNMSKVGGPPPVIGGRRYMED
jgi:hypothetical protein